MPRNPPPMFTSDAQLQETALRYKRAEADPPTIPQTRVMVVEADLVIDGHGMETVRRQVSDIPPSVFGDSDAKQLHMEQVRAVLEWLRTDAGLDPRDRNDKDAANAAVERQRADAAELAADLAHRREAAAAAELARERDAKARLGVQLEEIQADAARLANEKAAAEQARQNAEELRVAAHNAKVTAEAETARERAKALEANLRAETIAAELAAERAKTAAPVGVIEAKGEVGGP